MQPLKQMITILALSIKIPNNRLIEPKHSFLGLYPEIKAFTNVQKMFSTFKDACCNIFMVSNIGKHELEII